MAKFRPGQSGNPRGPLKKVPRRDASSLVRLYASEGWDEASIGRKALGVSAPTWHRIKREHPEIAESLAAGRGDLHNSTFAVLKKAADNGNVVAAMFILKARFGYQEGSQVAESRPQVIINLPGAVALDQYKAPLIAERVERCDE